MGAEENKAIVRRMLGEAFHKGIMSLVDQYVDANWEYHGPLPGIGRGPDGCKALTNMFRSGLPDLHVTVEEMVAEDNKVFTQLLFTGTHTNVFMGVPPTGKKLLLRSGELWYFRNGKIVESRPFPDQLGTLKQLGFTVVPPPKK